MLINSPGLRAQDHEVITPFAPQTVVATIDDEALTLGELMIRYATLPQPQRDAYASRRGGLTDFLSDTVGNLIVARQALRLEVTEDPLFEILMEIHREEVLRDLYARRTVLAQIDETVVMRRYEDLKEIAFQRQPVARMSLILVSPVAEDPPPNSSGDDAVGHAAARAKINVISRDLADGGDFADLARRLSEDVSSADGGDIGWVGRDDLVPELSKAVFSLAAGETSVVVESELGFYLARVIERRHGGLVPYELVWELMYQELVGERAPALALQARQDRDRLMEQHQIELFPERLPW
jgi:peptidyl-prolyl cis-trans isomerase C